MTDEEVVDRIIHSWDEWDGEAQQLAQLEQNPDAWRQFMEEKLRNLIAFGIYA